MSLPAATENNAKTPSHLLKRVNGVQRVVLFYDPDLYTTPVTVSVSLLTDTEDVPGTTHFNTLHTSGQEYSNGIKILPIPAKTKVIGLRRTKPGSTQSYYIPSDYDVAGDFTYEWRIAEGQAAIISSAARSVTLQFGEDDHNLLLICTISDATGGSRQLETLIQVGNQPQKLLVVRGTKYNEQ